MINEPTGSMASGPPISNGHDSAGAWQGGGGLDSAFTVKAGLARMLQGGVIMDVVNAEQV